MNYFKIFSILILFTLFLNNDYSMEIEKSKLDEEFISDLKLPLDQEDPLNLENLKSDLKLGSNPNLITKGTFGSNLTILDIAVSDLRNLELVKLLLKSGANPNLISPSKKFTPLDNALYKMLTYVNQDIFEVSNQDIVANMNNLIDIATVLLEHSANPRISQYKTYSAMIFADPAKVARSFYDNGMWDSFELLDKVVNRLEDLMKDEHLEVLKYLEFKSKLDNLEKLMLEATK